MRVLNTKTMTNEVAKPKKTVANQGAKKTNNNNPDAKHKNNGK